MTMGKRQLVLAALVVALGAAVYLNAVFTGNSQLPATQAVASGDNRQYGQTLQVNGSATSGNKASSAASAGKTVSSASSGKSSAVTTAAGADDYFIQAQLIRQKAQDEAKEQVAKILEDTKSNDTAKKEAVAKAAVITQSLLKQADIETLIRAKGYQNCVVTLGNNQCDVVVKTKANTQDDAVIIQDIVSGQTGLSFDKIHIIERT